MARAPSSPMRVLTDIRNRGTKDTLFLGCDGLKGLPEVVGNVGPRPFCSPHPPDPQTSLARLGRVRPLPELRPRDPKGDLLDQRDRVAQCSLPPRHQSPWTLPHRASVPVKSDRRAAETKGRKCERCG